MSRVVRLAGVLALNVAAVSNAAPWIVAPTAETATANQDGAALEASAQELAKEKRYDQAVTQFERLDRQFPSSTHDCYLALAYLRTGDLTRAQLFDDVARLRSGARPDWCADDLGRQLAAKLRDADFAPLTVKVKPPDATVQVAGLLLRGIDAVWLRPGTYEVSARADGRVPEVAQVAVTPPGASVSLELHAPAPTPVAQAPAPNLTPQQPPTSVASTLQLKPSPRRDARVLWPAWAGFGVGGASIAAGAVFHALAVSSRNSANAAYAGTPAFESASSDFSRDRSLALGGYALGAIATGLGAWWLASHPGAAADDASSTASATSTPSASAPETAAR